MKRTLNKDIQNGTIGMKSHKHKVVTEAQEQSSKESKHAESTLHLQFCKWVRDDLPKEHPNLANYPLQFVRHEREKFRSKYSGNLMKIYNSDWDKLPDFEGLFQSGIIKPSHQLLLGFNHAFGLYIEFKRPGRTITLADGITIKSEFLMQYRCHMHLWSIGRCAYFCNDLEEAKKLLTDYLAGNPRPMQKFVVPVSKSDKQADEFFGQFGL